MRNSSITLLSLTLSLPHAALAWQPPSYPGYTPKWSENFAGAAGSSPANNWNVITGNLGVNGELETYRSSSRNVQHSGGETLQLVPWKDGTVSGGWSSGRIESKYTVTPAPKTITRVEARIRFGSNAVVNKQGLWPAFWMLGQSLRTGAAWPACGELDVLETINGALTGYGTAHCNIYPGGICNEGQGIGNHVSIPDQGWHTWRLEWDLRSTSWDGETIKWSMDGNVFHTITGSRIGNAAVWNSLAHSPMYFILNMAVGGNCKSVRYSNSVGNFNASVGPGYPNGATIDGYGSMMEVAYVAHYVAQPARIADEL